MQFWVIAMMLFKEQNFSSFYVVVSTDSFGIKCLKTYVKTKLFVCMLLAQIKPGGCWYTSWDNLALLSSIRRVKKWFVLLR